jgi:hypothetical protein
LWIKILGACFAVSTRKKDEIAPLVPLVGVNVCPGKNKKFDVVCELYTLNVHSGHKVRKKLHEL